jgi:hypothetical protein
MQMLISSRQAEVVMPRSQMTWMFDQPDTILSTSEAHYEFLQGDYCFVKPITYETPTMNMLSTKTWCAISMRLYRT